MAGKSIGMKQGGSARVVVAPFPERLSSIEPSRSASPTALAAAAISADITREGAGAWPRTNVQMEMVPRLLTEDVGAIRVGLRLAKGQCRGVHPEGRGADQGPVVGQVGATAPPYPGGGAGRRRRSRASRGQPCPAFLRCWRLAASARPAAHRRAPPTTSRPRSFDMCIAKESETRSPRE
jgi:hypothetical protein